MSAAAASRSHLYDKIFLTPKQREVAELCDDGCSVYSIARQLGISRQAVMDRILAVENKIKKHREAA